MPKTKIGRSRIARTPRIPRIVRIRQILIDLARRLLATVRTHRVLQIVQHLDLQIDRSRPDLRIDPDLRIGPVLPIGPTPARRIALIHRTQPIETRAIRATEIDPARTDPAQIDRSRRAVHGFSPSTRLIVGILVSGFAAAVLARTPDAQRFFEHGRSAFERQEYAQALAAFEAALAADMDGPAIHFNIGVAAYRAGAYDRARAAFERVALTRTMAPLAHYNLGLVALAQDDEQRAIDAFVRAYSESEDERLRSLARARLDEIGRDAPSDLVWVAYASSGIGHDDNVTLTSGGQALGIARESDVYGDTFIVGSLQLDESWRFDADASWLNYADLDEYDQWGVGAGARYRFALAPWTLDLGAQVGTAYLDGERLDVRESLYVQAARALADALSLRMRYRITNVEGSDDYPGLDGLAHELTARVSQRIGTWTATYGYAFELNDYDSEALSTLRHRIAADLRVPLTRAWAVRGSVAYRHSDYDHPEIDTEQRIELGASAELALTDRWMLVLQYAFTDNDGAPEFSYRRNRLFARVDVTF